ncbi:cytidine deaminase [Clostridium paraputrificum]|uniref:cytidine deaminase n=1 Tax=Clostridium paraputrificum TaxID=29363 RepID=UPI003D341F39
MDNRELILKAIEAREKAYCPYSNFKVGAAALFEDGKIYTGCNIENASYGATNCAERTAIFNGVSQGNKSLKALALIGDINNFTYPCGICRQVISEFAANGDIKIYIVKNEKEVLEKTLDEIMPGTFTKKDLGN